MRVISGKYKRSNIEGFNIDGTRPTMDRVKESMFALIQNTIKDSICLDLFAGSGSLGIEALSNGAKCCYFVDNNAFVINTLQKNINKIKIEEPYYIIKKDYKEALEYFHKNNIKFNLILLDPPYQLNFINQCLDLIVKYDLLNDKGQIICEFENELVDNSNLECIKERRYGSKNIKVFQKRN
jgi:16S rRNA (guanine966-N2)-methyltransferase